MERAIGILPSFCWQTVQKISQAHNMVAENTRRGLNRLRPNLKTLQETRAAQREKKEAQIQEKERQLEQIAAEERQLKEKERNAFLEQSSYKILLRDKDVENFNRILNDQRMNKQNKLLAANQREKHIAAQILAKDNGEMKPWYHSVEERIMNEDCNRKKNLQADVEFFNEMVRKKKQLAGERLELEKEDKRRVMLEDAYINQKDKEEMEKKKEEKRKFIHQNVTKPKLSKTEKLARASKEQHFKEVDTFFSKAKAAKADKLKRYQMKIQTAYDHLMKIGNEEASKFASSEKEMTKVIGLRRIKEKQQEEEKNEKRAAMQKSILEANAEKVREKLEAKQIEKEKSKKRLGDLMEADRLHAAEIEQKKQQKQQDLLEYSNFNSEMAANKRALQMEKRKGEIEEQKRILLDIMPVPVKQYIESEMQKAEEEGLDMPYIKKKMSKTKPARSENAKTQSKVFDHCSDLTHIKLSQAEMPKNKSYFLPPLPSPPRVEKTTSLDLQKPVKVPPIAQLKLEQKTET
ncbi:PREDICTED: calponin homology domain-containing protein DDB_G0272472-like [Poecilia mexicana]|uniref:calponin homology domain-containing protein DDB_G0272472-like n=1 Tax=Poecilia mexicana TaxID=48701 RepID=UPI00072DF1C7|nr:PREDICTED: calponin homology domain-containing protein DDB_G0272472-like [Poecilia mexicana]XP_014865277.1 PREDICTED: calponin homology domain-containing protein DDB_G0272472-like [Poecilia mexicana]